MAGCGTCRQTLLLPLAWMLWPVSYHKLSLNTLTCIRLGNHSCHWSSCDFSDSLWRLPGWSIMSIESEHWCSCWPRSTAGIFHSGHLAFFMDGTLNWWVQVILIMKLKHAYSCNCCYKTHPKYCKLLVRPLWRLYVSLKMDIWLYPCPVLCDRTDMSHGNHQGSEFNTPTNKTAVLTACFHMTQYHAATLLGLEGPITCVIKDHSLFCFLTWTSLVHAKKSEPPPSPTPSSG